METMTNTLSGTTVHPKGLLIAPSSDPNDDPGTMSLYVADYGGQHITDGRIYEIQLSSNPTEPALFSTTDDNVDFNTLTKGSYLAGSQYEALGGNDTVTLPATAAAAAAAGYNPVQTAFHGNEGNDTITGGALNDSIYGDAGNDILVGGSGIDWVDGGAGTDIAALNGLHGGGFDIIQAGNMVYALDGVDHSYDAIVSVEGFWGISQAIGLGDVRTFDALAYAASYDDLAQAFRTNADAALSHYVTGGFFEGRHDSFDAAQYLANYADLQGIFGSDTAAATAHFLSSGVDEHRLAEDPLDYIASYADLIGAFHGHSQAEHGAIGLAHYQAAGNAEGRRGGIDFDADQYLANYADLRAAFGGDDDAAAAHFINSGYFEHRLSEDPLEYIASYADLIGAFHGQTESQMRASGIAHYQTGGFNEGREAGIDFNVDQYLANYADLRAAFADGHGGYNEDAAIYHYIEAGYFEGRTDHVLTA
jgi:serralysin